jgi:hypothetical protein
MWPELMSADVLAERGLFRFDDDARATIDDFAREMRPVASWHERALTPELTTELLALTAAEYALVPKLERLEQVVPVREPITVRCSAAILSVLKCNCASIEWCARSLMLSDITAFSGDISKLSSVEAFGGEMPDAIGDVARAVDRLERAHAEAPAELSQRLAASGILRLQGFLWAMKLVLPQQDIAEAAAGAYEAFELDAPTPMPVHA